VSVVLAQSIPTPLKFEIASVRPADPRARSSNVLLDPGESLRITNVPLRKIVTYAYDIRDFQLAGGPGWMDVERYDITAKAFTGDGQAAESGVETDDQRKARVSRVRERLRSLLADRFHLVVHAEEKEQTILALRVAKAGSKIVEAAGRPGEQQGRVSTLDGHIQGYGAPISMLVTQLSIVAGQVVQDRTGLSGKYDFVLDWAADARDRETDRPSFFTAIEEQLGLRLERAKGPVQVAVIDHIERPSEN
jgi:bla regulator protein BlaR1